MVHQPHRYLGDANRPFLDLNAVHLVDVESQDGADVGELLRLALFQQAAQNLQLDQP
ncbi:MAG: hypothetical protein H0T51_11595 [Pirellulales bacterium]|nr:hypothetical protein [Pirellulales bacterium]